MRGDVDKLAARIADDMPRPQALRHLNETLSLSTGYDTSELVAHMTYNVKLVTAIRVHCERKRKAPPWA